MFSLALVPLSPLLFHFHTTLTKTTSFLKGHRKYPSYKLSSHSIDTFLLCLACIQENVASSIRRNFLRPLHIPSPVGHVVDSSKSGLLKFNKCQIILENSSDGMTSIVRLIQKPIRSPERWRELLGVDIKLST